MLKTISSNKVKYFLTRRFLPSTNVQINCLNYFFQFLQLTSAINYLMCMVIAISSLGIVLTDPQVGLSFVDQYLI